jgi:hypothetical protein
VQQHGCDVKSLCSLRFDSINLQIVAAKHVKFYVEIINIPTSFARNLSYILKTINMALVQNLDVVSGKLFVAGVFSGGN